MTLIIGGSGSGKSAYAEAYMEACALKNRKYYLATMQVYDKEGREKVEKHRQMRAGKHFITVEQPVQIEKALEKMETGDLYVLLECMSNLVANEMFAGNIPQNDNVVAEKIIKGISGLKEACAHLVIVSNNVFEDGILYDETTMAYLQAMGEVNEKLASMADEVIEVVVGIGLKQK